MVEILNVSPLRGGPRVTTVCHTRLYVRHLRCSRPGSHLRWRSPDLRRGLPWLAEAEEAIGICRALAACVPAWRRAHIDHSIEALTRQRVFGIACGYEDQNDADTLRADPLLKLVCGRRPESDADLASQPTLARFENAVGRHACRAVAHALLGVYLRARERDGCPTHIVLDIDSTDDPTHGAQEGTAYHGY